MIEACKAQVPPLIDWGAEHSAACIRVAEIKDQMSEVGRQTSEGVNG